MDNEVDLMKYYGALCINTGRNGRPTIALRQHCHGAFDESSSLLGYTALSNDLPTFRKVIFKVYVNQEVLVTGIVNHENEGGKIIL